MACLSPPHPPPPLSLEGQLADEKAKRAALERLRAQLVAMRGESYINAIESQLAESDKAAAADGAMSGRGSYSRPRPIDIRLDLFTSTVGTQYNERDAKGKGCGRHLPRERGVRA